jgi:hypothetical protein
MRVSLMKKWITLSRMWAVCACTLAIALKSRRHPGRGSTEGAMAMLIAAELMEK